jgi:hypothetical protein
MKTPIKKVKQLNVRTYLRTIKGGTLQKGSWLIADWFESLIKWLLMYYGVVVSDGCWW